MVTTVSLVLLFHVIFQVSFTHECFTALTTFKRPLASMLLHMVFQIRFNNERFITYNTFVRSFYRVYFFHMIFQVTFVYEALVTFSAFARPFASVTFLRMIIQCSFASKICVTFLALVRFFSSMLVGYDIEEHLSWCTAFGRCYIDKVFPQCVCVYGSSNFKQMSSSSGKTDTYISPNL